MVLPITHTPPTDASHAIEIPAGTKRRLGLDAERSWIVLTETTALLGRDPTFGLREPGDTTSIAYGTLPKALFYEVRSRWLALYKSHGARTVVRTE